MQQIIITEVIYSLAIVGLEIPSGYFADRVGRKPCLVLAALFWAVGAVFYAHSPGFIGVSIGATLWGIGSSFSSGAEDALLYETLIHLKKEKEYKKLQGNLFFWGRMAGLIGSIVAGFMASVHISLPAYATIAPFVIWFFLALTLRETRHHQEDLETWSHLKDIFQKSIIENSKLRYFILYTGILSFFAIEFWLTQKYWGFIGVPIVYFGIIVGALSIFSGLGARYAKEIEKFIGEKASLIIIPIVPFIVWLIFANVHFLWIVPLSLLTAALKGFSIPVFNTYVHSHVSSDRRATIMSLMNFIQKGVFLVFAPLLGWVIDAYSIQTAFLLGAIILALFGVISLSLLKKEKII